MEGVADGHVHCWEMGSDHTHCRGRGQEIGQRHVWSPGAGAGAPLSSGSRPELSNMWLAGGSQVVITGSKTEQPEGIQKRQILS